MKHAKNVLRLFNNKPINKNEKQTYVENNVSDILEIGEQLGYDSYEINWVVSRNTEIIKNLVENINDISSNSEDISTNSVKGLKELKGLSLAATNLKETASNVSDLSKNNLAKVEERRLTMNTAQEIVERVSQEMDASSEDIENLLRLTENVSNFVNFVKIIARQTNLLAINASIEAARAGQLGRGFGVVAQEIKKLAERSKEQAEDISNTAELINKGINKVFAISKDGASNLRDVKSSIIVGKKAMDDAVIAFENISEINTKLYDSSNYQAITAEHLTDIFTSLSEKTKLAAETTSKVANLTKDQENHNERLLDIAAKLLDKVYLLQKQSINFKTKDDIIFGINPALSPETIKFLYLPVIASVCKQIKLKPRIIITTSYDALANCLIDGIIDIGWFSPLAYINAKSKASVIPLVTPIVNGTPDYLGYIITTKKSGITSLKETKGQNMAFVDPKSASGYAYPRMLLRKMGINPDKDLSAQLFLGTHSKVVEAVLSGDVSVGATYSEAIDEAKHKGLEVERLVYLAQTEPIPKDCIVVRNDLDTSIVEILKEAFLDYKNVGIDNQWKTSIINGFIVAQDGNYDMVREVAKLAH